MKIKGGNNYLEGIITVPGDKSISHRAIMLGSISEGKTEIENFLLAEDCLSTVKCFRNMGVDITINDNQVVVKGVGLNGLKEPSEILDVGNSGTTIRLISGILASQDFPSVITGDESIRRRPMDRIIKPLRKMGAIIKGKDDKLPPIKINPTENLCGIAYQQPVASAQVKSCVLLAGLHAKGTTTVIQPSLSRDHTERMLKLFGADIKVNDNVVTITGKNTLQGQKIYVPSDISSASFFIVGGLILKGSHILIKNVGLNETRSGIIDVLKAMGGNIQIENIRELNNEPVGDIEVKYSKLNSTSIGGDIIPRLIDELPVLALAASVAKGVTIIKDADELKKKESNRISAIVSQFKKMGVNIKETDDGMVIEGGKELMPAKLETFNDHRIAMTLAIASLYAKGESEIDNVSCIRISNPKFFETLDEIIRTKTDKLR